MPINVAVRKESTNESNLSLIKRFTRRLQGSGIIRHAKKITYAERPLSDYKKKRQALKRIERRTKLEHLRKLGLIEDVSRKKSH